MVYGPYQGTQQQQQHNQQHNQHPDHYNHNRYNPNPPFPLPRSYHPPREHSFHRDTLPPIDSRRASGSYHHHHTYPPAHLTPRLLHPNSSSNYPPYYTPPPIEEDVKPQLPILFLPPPPPAPLNSSGGKSNKSSSSGYLSLSKYAMSPTEDKPKLPSIAPNNTSRNTSTNGNGNVNGGEKKRKLSGGGEDDSESSTESIESIILKTPLLKPEHEHSSKRHVSISKNVLTVKSGDEDSGFLDYNLSDLARKVGGGGGESIGPQSPIIAFPMQWMDPNGILQQGNGNGNGNGAHNLNQATSNNNNTNGATNGANLDPALSNLRTGGGNSSTFEMPSDLKLDDNNHSSGDTAATVAALQNHAAANAAAAAGGVANNPQLMALMEQDKDKKELPFSRSPELRVSHKLAERKRRKEMKDLFDELRESLPAERGSRSSKWEILSKSIDYIQWLKKSNDSLQADVEKLRSELNLARGGTGNSTGFGYSTYSLPQGYPAPGTYAAAPGTSAAPAATTTATGTTTPAVPQAQVANNQQGVASTAVPQAQAVASNVAQ